MMFGRSQFWQLHFWLTTQLHLVVGRESATANVSRFHSCACIRRIALLHRQMSTRTNRNSDPTYLYLVPCQRLQIYRVWSHCNQCWIEDAWFRLSNFER